MIGELTDNLWCKNRRKLLEQALPNGQRGRPVLYRDVERRLNRSVV
jgi:hypothetical protein